jgi:hypothetical protein
MGGRKEAITGGWSDRRSSRPRGPGKVSGLGCQGTRRFKDFEPTPKDVLDRHGLWLGHKPEALAQLAECVGRIEIAAVDERVLTSPSDGMLGALNCLTPRLGRIPGGEVHIGDGKPDTTGSP